jgi:hypothetical protein
LKGEEKAFDDRQSDLQFAKEKENWRMKEEMIF